MNEPDVYTTLYRHMLFDHSQDIIRFNYMKQPNLKITVNPFGDVVKIELIGENDEIPTV